MWINMPSGLRVGGGGGGCDSPRPQSDPLKPKKQWHVPATQSPFPKQLLGQSSTESAREQSGAFLNNALWKNNFPPTHFLWVIVPLLMTVIRTGLQSCQHFCLTAKHFSVLLRFHKNGGIYWRANRFRSSGLRPENVSEFANQFDGDKWRASFDKPNLTLLRLLPWVMFSCFLPWMDFHFALRFWQKQKVGQEN